MLTKTITDISEYLSKQGFSLSKQFDDGRINVSVKRRKLWN